MPVILAMVETATLAYMVKFQVRETVSNKRFQVPEDQHLRLSSDLHTCRTHMHTHLMTVCIHT